MNVEEIRRRFEFSTDFNEIFDAFEASIAAGNGDLDLYRLLFMNPSLTADELCLFGEKAAAEFPDIAYDVFMWLARLFEATHSTLDNFELTFTYYRKAAEVRPEVSDPYLRAADCYEPDLNIPPISRLIDFLRNGAERVEKPRELHERLVYFYETLGNDEMQDYYRRKLDGSRPAPDAP